MTSFVALGAGVLFGGAPRQVELVDQATFELLVFDASINEVHLATSDITDHPVEDGVDISDHVRRKPDALDINVIMTNDPPILLKALRLRPISGFGDPNTRAEDTVSFLEAFKNRGALAQIFTTLKDYENMLITSMSTPRDATTGNIASIQLTLREIIKASTLRAAVDPAILRALRRKKPRAGDLKKQGVKTPAVVEQPDDTVLVKITNFVTGAG